MTNQFLSSRSFARAAILAFVCLFSSTAEAITSSVGSTPGSFAVSPSSIDRLVATHADNRPQPGHRRRKLGEVSH